MKHKLASLVARLSSLIPQRFKPKSLNLGSFNIPKALSEQLPSKHKTKLFLVYIILIGVFATAIVHSLGESKTQAGFPNLQAGKYVGTIELPDRPKISKTTIYFERADSSHSLLAVIFTPNWKPKVLPLFVQGGDDLERKPDSYTPLEISIADSNFQLSGTGNGKEYRGIISQNGAVRGSWFLRPLSKAETQAGGIQVDDEWLQKKAMHRLRLDEFRSLTEANSLLEKRLKELENFQSNTSKLLEVRASIAEQAQQQLQKLRQEQEKYAARVSGLIRELNQLERITLGGRVVSLARRVSQREDKWYSVNWTDAQTSQADEQTAAEEIGINIRTLNKELREASEVQALKNQIKAEKSKIRALRAEFKRKKEGGKKKEQEKPGKSPDKKRPWWKRWDTVFGLHLPTSFDVKSGGE